MSACGVTGPHLSLSWSCDFQSGRHMGSCEPAAPHPQGHGSFVLVLGLSHGQSITGLVLMATHWLDVAFWGHACRLVQSRWSPRQSRVCGAGHPRAHAVLGLCRPVADFLDETAVQGLKQIHQQVSVWVLTLGPAHPPWPRVKAGSHAPRRDSALGSGLPHPPCHPRAAVG